VASADSVYDRKPLAAAVALSPTIRRAIGGKRCVGTRLLSEISESASRLSQGMVECGELGQGLGTLLCCQSGNAHHLAARAHSDWLDSAFRTRVTRGLDPRVHHSLQEQREGCSGKQHPFIRSSDISQPTVRPAAPARGRRNDRYADDAAVRSRGNRHGHHGVRPRVRRMAHAYANSGFAACTGPDWRR
jgi:hypothetical protein